ncbi:hypothetical protein SAMN05216174_104307 [Actinokineospora iranica]|uniref:Uncharacterized protein n=1 Tax=Actinokineospora iranica TaxID=1271860 RepID=A0A1G6PHJ4_9PSEU|nr:hypothetical protein SAMN05216174_104307 [Actinokineospora iranica]
MTALDEHISQLISNDVGWKASKYGTDRAIEVE